MDAASVEQAKQQVILTPQNKDRAPRTLKAWKFDVSENQVQLYLALSKGRGRVSKQLMEKWSKTVVSKSSLVQGLWVVPRDRNPLLENKTDVQPFLVDPWSCDEWPQGINRESVVILDKGYPPGIAGPLGPPPCM